MKNDGGYIATDKFVKLNKSETIINNRNKELLLNVSEHIRNLIDKGGIKIPEIDIHDFYTKTPDEIIEILKHIEELNKGDD